MLGSTAPHGLREHVVLDPVLIDRHEAHLRSVPHFIADVPPGHLVRLRMTVGGAPLAHRRVHRTVDVLHFFRGGMRVAKAGVYANVRLHVEQLVEDHVLVDAQVVLLHFVPGGVQARGPLVGIADGIPPVPAGDHVPSRPAEHGRTDLFHLLDQVGAISRRCCPRASATRRRCGTSLSRFRRFPGGASSVSAPAVKLKGNLAYSVRRRLIGMVCRSAGIGPPDEADRHFRAGIGRQDRRGRCTFFRFEVPGPLPGCRAAWRPPASPWGCAHLRKPSGGPSRRTRPDPGDGTVEP